MPPIIGAAILCMSSEPVPGFHMIGRRPATITLTVIVAGLLPIMWSHGTGSEVMQRIAAPMIGGMITAPLLSLLVIPAAYRILRRRELNAQVG